MTEAARERLRAGDGAGAEALLRAAAGRVDEAREWFAKAVEADRDGSTDASDRLAELDGVEFVDALNDEDQDDETDADEVEGEADESEETPVEAATEAEPETVADSKSESEADKD